MARFLEANQFILNVSENYQELCENVTERILAFSNEKIAIQGRFTIVLSGGLTPRGFINAWPGLLTSRNFNGRRSISFFSDERWVSKQGSKK